MNKKKFCWMTVFWILIFTVLTSCGSGGSSSNSETDPDSETPDNVPPTVTDTTQTEGETDVDISSPIKVVFNEEIDSTSVTEDTFVVMYDSENVADMSRVGAKKSTDSNVVEGVRTVEQNTIIFTPTESLKPASTYTVTAKSTIKDLSGNPLGQDVVLSFETSKPPEVDTLFPLDQSNGVATNVEISISFSEEMDPDSFTSDSFVVSVQETGVSVAGSTTFTNTILTWNPDLSLDEFTEYHVSLNADIADLSGNGLKDTPYTFSFTTGDFAAPFIVETEPSNGGQDIELSPTVSITFSERMAPLTVTGNTSDNLCNGSMQLSTDNFTTCIPAVDQPLASNKDKTYTAQFTGADQEKTEYRLKLEGMTDLKGKALQDNPYILSFTTLDQTSPSVTELFPVDSAVDMAKNIAIYAIFDEEIDPASVESDSFIVTDGSNNINGTVSVNDEKIEFRPEADLNNFTSYTATIKSIADLKGNVIGNNIAWSFRTKDTIAPLVSTVSPGNGSTQVSTSTDFSVTFNELMDATTVVTNTTSSQCDTSIQLSKDSFTSCVQMSDQPISSNSNQTFTFTPAQALGDNVEYALKLTTDIVDSNGNSLADDYISSFTTGDFTDPEILSQYPTDNQTDVSADVALTITFNEPLNQSTVDANSFTLSQGGSSVPGVISFSENDVKFTPDNLLKGNTVYTVALTTDITDLSGNGLQNPVSYDFTTEYLLVVSDTEIVYSGTDVFGEDHDYQTAPHSYTDNGDGTVTDNNTQLMWDKNSTADLYKSNATETCNNLTTGGYTDWRVPSATEMLSILTYGIMPATDDRYFNETELYFNLWTSSLYGASITGVPYGQTIIIVGVTGRTSEMGKNSSKQDVKCVRGDKIWKKDFVDKGDGTVFHRATGILWQKNLDGTYHWEDAISYCESLTLAGFDDWRLPNANEAMTIVKEDVQQPTVDLTFFPDDQVIVDGQYWTSTAWYRSSTPNQKAMVLDLRGGRVLAVYSTSGDENKYKHKARCMRRMR